MSLEGIGAGGDRITFSFTGQTRATRWLSRCAAQSQLLLDRGMDVNTERDDHCTPLHVAYYFGKVETLRLRLFLE